MDLRLGNSFTVCETPSVQGVDQAVILAEVTGVDVAEKVVDFFGTTKTLGQNETFRLEPGQFVLAYTQEKITMPKDLVARVEGRSSFARLGIAVHQTAPTVHADWEGYLRLEVKNNGAVPLLLSEGLKLCQLVVERVGPPDVEV